METPLSPKELLAQKAAEAFQGFLGQQLAWWSTHYPEIPSGQLEQFLTNIDGEILSHAGLFVPEIIPIEDLLITGGEALRRVDSDDIRDSLSFSEDTVFTTEELAALDKAEEPNSDLLKMKLMTVRSHALLYEMRTGESPWITLENNFKKMLFQALKIYDVSIPPQRVSYFTSPQIRSAEIDIAEYDTSHVGQETANEFTRLLSSHPDIGGVVAARDARHAVLLSKLIEDYFISDQRTPEDFLALIVNMPNANFPENLLPEGK